MTASEEAPASYWYRLDDRYADIALPHIYAIRQQLADLAPAPQTSRLVVQEREPNTTAVAAIRAIRREVLR